ncbi:SRPBCC family protein [Pseudactinotalea sp. Z1739]|uniref:SRPBCC family protein n=1 Tax=Pseudactinotalea sp. Z1739 TaxID=3413028 RepID=UPI003C7A16E2
MKVTGEASLKAGPEQLWAAFNDPAALVHTIPGCQRLEETGTDTYKMTLNAGVAAIKGVYDGRVQLLDKVEPRSLRMVASGSGGPGTIEVSVDVQVEADDDGSRLTYDADATVGGMIGGVSQRMLATVGKRLAADFFRNMDSYIANAGPDTAVQSQAPAGEASAPAASGQHGTDTSTGTGAGAGAGSGPGVFERPPTAPAAGVSGDLLKGALGGAALVLAGVIAGGLLGRRRG